MKARCAYKVAQKIGVGAHNNRDGAVGLYTLRRSNRCVGRLVIVILPLDNLVEAVGQACCYRVKRIGTRLFCLCCGVQCDMFEHDLTSLLGLSKTVGGSEKGHGVVSEFGSLSGGSAIRVDVELRWFHGVFIGFEPV